MVFKVFDINHGDLSISTSTDQEMPKLVKLLKGKMG